MKKLFLSLTFMIATLTAHAGDYDYLTFETTDGAKVSVAISSLTITISGTTLTAGSQSFVLTSLSRMYFSPSDETTGIDQIENGTSVMEEVTAIYDMQGRRVMKEQMRSGQVYVLKTKSGARVCRFTGKELSKIVMK